LVHRRIRLEAASTITVRLRVSNKLLFAYSEVTLRCQDKGSYENNAPIRKRLGNFDLSEFLTKCLNLPLFPESYYLIVVLSCKPVFTTADAVGKVGKYVYILKLSTSLNGQSWDG
jgi:hypothetical protein